MLANEYARKHMKKAILRTRRAYHDQKNELKPGQRVWLFTPKTDGGVPKKLQNFWTGPYKILPDSINDTTLRIKADGKWSTGKEEPIAVSIDRLKAFRFDDREQGPNRTNLCCELDPHCEAINLPSETSSDDDSFDEGTDEEMDAAVQGAADDVEAEVGAGAAEAGAAAAAVAAADVPVGAGADAAAEAAADAPADATADTTNTGARGLAPGEDDPEQEEEAQAPEARGERPKRTHEKTAPSTPERKTGATPKTGTKKRKKEDKETFYTPSSSLQTRARSTSTRKSLLPLKYHDFEMSTLEEEEEKEEKAKGAIRKGTKKKK